MSSAMAMRKKGFSFFNEAQVKLLPLTLAVLIECKGMGRKYWEEP